MKKSKELIGLPIISISGVNQIGKVKGLIINPDNFSVEFLTVEQEDWQVSVKAVPFKKITGIGEAAIMVEQVSSIIDLEEIPFINQLLNKKIHIIGSQVLTIKGERSGDIIDYFFNEENGQLESLLINSGNKETFFPIENVLSLGKELVIINDSSIPEINDQFAKMQNGVQQATPSQTRAETHSQTDKKAELKAKLIELLKGNSIKRDVYGKTGDLLFAKGTILTDQYISVLQKEGAKVLIEVAMDLTE